MQARAHVAIVSALLSFLGKKVGSILQAIFGWSVTALFGRLSPKKQLAVTVALVLSIAWPFFVVGLFLPGVAGWALAILPLEQWLGQTALRVIWASLAIASPPLVGLLVHLAAPTKRGSAARSLVHGYPLALGFFVAFVVTVVTVPLVKLASVVKRWAESHVYVQPRPGAYDAVLRELAEACARAGLTPTIEEPPARMVVATTVLKKLARGMVTPIVAEEVRVVRADGLEMYLYPSDLLIRGEEKVVGRVRAMMTRTDVDADAYLVASAAAQRLQDELGRLLGVVRDHERAGHAVSGAATDRLVAIWREMNEARLPFDEWVVLESIARRLERRIERHGGADASPLDRDEDGLADVAARANATLRQTREETEKMAIESPTPERMPLEEASTADLVRAALDEAKELVRIEVALAKDEVKAEVNGVKRAAIFFAVATAGALVFLSMLGVALVFALGATAPAALGVAAGFLLITAVAAYVGWSTLPKKPLDRTRQRLQSDVNQLKEHIA